jgi:hypothetical protein
MEQLDYSVPVDEIYAMGAHAVGDSPRGEHFQAGQATTLLYNAGRFALPVFITFGFPAIPHPRSSRGAVRISSL